MRWVRDAVCLLALLALTSLSVWGAVDVSRQDFPDAESLEPVDLRTWLTERDLSASSDAMRSRVSRRFEEELRGGGRSMAAELRGLDADQRRHLEANLSVVLEHWYRDKVQRYFEQRPNRRQAWLDGEIEQLEQAFGRGREGNRSPLNLPGSLYVMGVIGARIEEWVQRSDPETQKQMREFQAAVNARLMARQRRGS